MKLQNRRGDSEPVWKVETFRNFTNISGAKSSFHSGWQRNQEWHFIDRWHHFIGDETPKQTNGLRVNLKTSCLPGNFLLSNMNKTPRLHLKLSPLLWLLSTIALAYSLSLLKFVFSQTEQHVKFFSRPIVWASPSPRPWQRDPHPQGHLSSLMQCFLFVNSEFCVIYIIYI